MSHLPRTRRRSATSWVVALVLVIGGCTPEVSEPTTTGVEGAEDTTTTQPAPESYFDLLRMLRDGVRASPDHLAFEIERVAAGGDLDAILTFVRDHFTVVPPHESVWVSPDTVQWWGMDGALRSGMGTPREIAEVLAHAVRLAGHEPTIVRRLGPATRPDLLAPVPLPAVDPGVDVTGDPLPPAPSLSPESADRLGAAALAALPTPFDVPVFTSDAPTGMPTVVVDDGGTQLIAGLWTESGGWEPIDFVPEAGPARATPEVSVRVLVAMTDDPDNPVEVATASVPSADMVGRPLIVNFVPAVSEVTDLLAVAPADVNTVVPTIRLGGLDRDPVVLSDATALTLDGRLLAEEGPGWVVGSDSFGGTGDADAVTSVEILRVNAGRYPWVEVDVDVSGSDGIVDDLPASDFVLIEAGEPRPVLLRRASAPRPRVIFLLDDSLSIPEQYRDEGAAEVVTAIAGRIQAERPDAEFRVALAGVDGAGALPWTQDLERLGRDALSFTITGGLWEAYAEASTFGGNVIVFLTDGRSVTPTNDPQPEPPAEVVPALLAAPPAIMLGAGDFGEAYVGIAELTGGVTLDVEDQDAAVEQVLEQIDTLLTTYSMSYRAIGDGTGERSVSVAVGSVGHEASYVVPDFDAPPVGPAGLYLELSVAAVPYTRTLAGVPFGSRRDATLADTEDVRRALFGTYTIHGEPGTPTPSVIVDEALSAAIQWEAVLDADGPEQLDALASVSPMSPFAATFTLPYVDPPAEPRTIDLGMRFWVGVERPANSDDGEVWLTGVDLVPLSGVVTLADSVEHAFEATVTRTGRLSGLEDLLFDQSPVDRLLGAELVDLLGVDPERRAEFRPVVAGWPGSTTFLVPVDGPADAAIAVRPDGTTVALGSTGLGVGITEEEVEANFDQIQSLLDMAGGLGGGPGAWAELEKAKMEKLRFATIVIIRMDAEGVADLIEEEVCDALSSAGDRLLGAGVRSAGLGGIADSLSEAVEMVNSFGGAAGFGGLPTGLDAC